MHAPPNCRVVTLYLAVTDLDRAIASIASADGPTPWTAVDRILGVLLTLPIFASLAGLVLPLADIGLYERNATAVHDAVLYASVLSRAALHCSGRAWVPASPKQHLLLDAFLNILGTQVRRTPAQLKARAL